MGDLNPDDFKLLNAVESAADLVKAASNNSEALYQEIHCIASTIKGLNSRTTSLIIEGSVLQKKLDACLIDNAEKDLKIDVLNCIIANLNNSSGSSKSAPHPDPEIFTGDNRALLENFLTDLNIKLNINND